MNAVLLWSCPVRPMNERFMRLTREPGHVALLPERRSVA
jgi:hypothetical protein